MSYQVFISYSYKDSELARDLVRRLEETGVKVFIDSKGLSAGSELTESIFRALRDSDEMVILLTDNAVNNSNIIFELGLADGLDKRVTAIVVNEGVEQRLPMIGRRFIKYSGMQKYIDSLKKRAKAA